ncbi:hypothetical protein AGIG_G913 [Arapaima gigas]
MGTGEKKKDKDTDLSGEPARAAARDAAQLPQRARDTTVGEESERESERETAAASCVDYCSVKHTEPQPNRVRRRIGLEPSEVVGD